MATVIYNCQTCKLGKRIEYPIEIRENFYRKEGSKTIPCGIWIQAIGGNKPTIYGGDLKGLCSSCGKAMKYGFLRANLVPSIPCGSKCLTARGPSCDCSCGGENHGGGH